MTVPAQTFVTVPQGKSATLKVNWGVQPVGYTPTAPRWVTGDPAVATVQPDVADPSRARVTGHKVGAAMIFATTTLGGRTASAVAAVTVIPGESMQGTIGEESGGVPVQPL